MKDPCCDANSYGFKCWCSAYRGLKARIEEDEGRGDHDRDQQIDRQFEEEFTQN